MPKIIENLESRLIGEARKQIRELGYSAVTIRSIAAGCGVGVGTVYNYFASKDDLLASYMLKDWNLRMEAIHGMGETAQTPDEVIRCMYDQLGDFARQHEGIIRDPAAITGFAPSYTRYHKLLRTQLAEPVRKFCDSDFAADFIAESMLHWTLAGRSFDEIYGMIQKLF